MTDATIEISRAPVGALAAPASLDISHDVVIDVGRRRVFDALLHTSDWWPHRTRSGAAIVLEPYVGGRFYESWDDGNGVLYGHVSHLMTPDDFAITGPLGLDGPLYGVWSVRLESVGHDRTVLRGRHRAFGAIDDAVRASTVARWARTYNEMRHYLDA